MSTNKLILFVPFKYFLLSYCVNAFSLNVSGDESIGIINVEAQTQQQHSFSNPNGNFSVPNISSSISTARISVTAPPIFQPTSIPSRFTNNDSAQPTAERSQLANASTSSSSTFSPLESTTLPDAHDIEVEPVASPQHQKQPAWQLFKSELNIWENDPTHTLVALVRLRHPLKWCALDARGAHLFTLEKRSPTLVRLLSRLSLDRESTSFVAFTVHCELSVPSSTADGHEDTLLRVSRDLVRQ